MASDEFTPARRLAGLASGPLLVSRLALAVPAAGIVASELLLFYGYTGYALWGHLGTLLFCVLAPLSMGEEAHFFQAFALVSCFRLVNLGMPVFVELTIYWFPLIYAPFAPVLYFIARSGDVVEFSFDLRRALLLAPVGAILGIALAHVEYAIIRPEALIPAWTVGNLALIAAVMIGFVGLVEELLYRGVLQTTLVSRYGKWPGILVASFFFGLMHSGYGLVGELVFAGSIGLLYGVLYEYTDSLAFVTVLHGVMNVFLFAVIPLRGPLL